MRPASYSRSRAADTQAKAGTATLISGEYDFAGRVLSPSSLASTVPMFSVPDGVECVIKNAIIDMAGGTYRPSIHGQLGTGRAFNVLEGGTLILDNCEIKNGIPNDTAPYAQGVNSIAYWNHHDGTYDYTFAVDGLIDEAWLNTNLSGADGQTVRYLDEGSNAECFVFDGAWYKLPKVDILQNWGTLTVENSRFESDGFTLFRAKGGTMNIRYCTFVDCYRSINNGGDAVFNVENSTFTDSGLFCSGAVNGSENPATACTFTNVMVTKSTRLSHYDQILGKVEDVSTFVANNFTITNANAQSSAIYAIRRTGLASLEDVTIEGWLSSTDVAEWDIQNSTLGPTNGTTTAVIYRLDGDADINLDTVTFKGITNTPIVVLGGTHSGTLTQNAVTITGGYNLMR